MDFESHKHITIFRFMIKWEILSKLIENFIGNKMWRSRYAPLWKNSSFASSYLLLLRKLVLGSAKVITLACLGLRCPLWPNDEMKDQNNIVAASSVNKESMLPSTSASFLLLGSELLRGGLLWCYAHEGGTYETSDAHGSMWTGMVEHS